MAMPCTTRQRNLVCWQTVVVLLLCLLLCFDVRVARKYLVHHGNSNNDGSTTAALVGRPTASTNSTTTATSDNNNTTNNYKKYAQARQHPGIQAQQQPEFPRWGNSQGIDMLGLCDYIKYTSISGKTQNVQLYIFGGSSSTMLGLSRQQQQQGELPRIWVSNRRRRAYAAGRWALNRRVKPTETLLEKALEYLFTTTTTKRWSRLKQVATTSGVPLLVKFGDYRGCHKYNYQSPTLNQTFSVPIFTVCASYHAYNCNYSFPLPSYALVDMIAKKQAAQDTTTRSTGACPNNCTSNIMIDWSSHFSKQQQEHPWNSKIRKVVWRGTNTGVRPLDKRLKKSPSDKDWPIRWRMVYEANHHNQNTTSSLDVGFHKVFEEKSQDWFDLVTSLDNKNDSNSNQSIMAMPMAGRLPQAEFQNYVGIFDVDGNAWSSRFADLLTMNSVVLKVEPESVDYFMPRLRPWVHYIPVAMNSSDLHSIAQYVLDPQNNDEMQQIVQNAHEWVQANFQYQRLVEDTLDILEFYVQQLDKHDDWRPDNGNHQTATISSSPWTDQLDSLIRDDYFRRISEEIIPLSQVHWSRQVGWRGIPPLSWSTSNSH